MLSGIMAFTKNEGMILFLPVIALTFAGFLYFSKLPREDKIKKAVIPGACILLLAGPWLAAKMIYGLSSGGFAFKFHPGAITDITRLFFWEGGSFNILWAAALILLLSNARLLKDRVFISYFAPAALAFSAVAAVFIFTSNYQWLELRTTINRTLLIVAPLILFSIGTLAGLSLAPGRENENHETQNKQRKIA